MIQTVQNATNHKIIALHAWKDTVLMEEDVKNVKLSIVLNALFKHQIAYNVSEAIS